MSTRSASAAPANLAITPTTCSTAGGTVLTITGTGFAATPTVEFGVGFPNPTVVTAPNVTFVSSTQITVIAPARAAGNSAMMVTNPDGSLDSLNPGCMYVAPTPTGSIGGRLIPQSNYSFPMACVDGTSIFGRLPNKKLIERGGSFSNSTATASTTNSGGEGYGYSVSIKGDSNQAAPTLFESPKPQSNYAVLQSVDSLSALDICDGTGCPLKVLTAFSYQVLTAAEMLTAEALQKGEVASASAPVATLNSSTIVKNVTITVTDLSLDQQRSFIGLRRWTENNWTLVDETVVANSTDTSRMGMTLSTIASAKLPFGVYAVVYSDPKCNSATPPTGTLPNGVMTPLVPAGTLPNGVMTPLVPAGTLPNGVMTSLVPAAVPAPPKSGNAGLTVSSSLPVLVAVLAGFAATVVASARIATRRNHR